MTSRVDAARAAERIAGEYVGDDQNMMNETLLVEDDTFRSLAVAYQQLGFVGGPTAGVYDGGALGGDGVNDYVAGQTENARRSIERALASRAAVVFDTAYAYRSLAEEELSA